MYKIRASVDNFCRQIILPTLKLYPYVCVFSQDIEMRKKCFISKNPARFFFLNFMFTCVDVISYREKICDEIDETCHNFH